MIGGLNDLSNPSDVAGDDAPGSLDQAGEGSTGDTGASPEGTPSNADATDGADWATSSDGPPAADSNPEGDAANSSADVGGVVVDAPGDATDGGATDGSPPPVCTNDLSNVGTGDFRIAFTLTTMTRAYSALLNQRSGCNAGIFWDIRLNQITDGGLLAEIDDGTNDVYVGTSGSLSDGLPHIIVLTRTIGNLQMQVDGVVQGTTPGTLSSTSRLGPLPSLRVGADVCDGSDGTHPLAGAVTSICVSY